MSTLYSGSLPKLNHLFFWSSVQLLSKFHGNSLITVRVILLAHKQTNTGQNITPANMWRMLQRRHLRKAKRQIDASGFFHACQQNFSNVCNFADEFLRNSEAKGILPWCREQRITFWALRPISLFASTSRAETAGDIRAILVSFCWDLANEVRLQKILQQLNFVRFSDDLCHNV